jgi:leucyl aminopeptidase
MNVSVSTRDVARTRAELVAVPLFQSDPSKWRLPKPVADLDKTLGGALRAVLQSGDFRGRSDESALVYPGKDLPVHRLLVLGLGEESKLDAEALRRAAGRAVQRASAVRAKSLALLVPSFRRPAAADAAQALAEGAVLGGYRSDAYREKPKDGPGDVTEVTFVFPRLRDASAARRAASLGATLAESQNLARRLSNEPANALPPEALAREAKRVAKETGLGVRVLDPAEMKRRKMGAILAVGQGSANPPRLIVLEHEPGRGRGTRRRPTLCLVGKGVTFDSGGISIKPAQGMEEMKHDMSGAAAVIGALRAAAEIDLPLRVVGVIGAVENMPSGSAYRPGDILRSMSGKTIEVVNTDAEGRVVLADALHYAVAEYEPDAVVDLATLTGACVVALGSWATGLFGNDERLIESIRRAGDGTGERMWPMPLLDEHREAMRSKFADIKNTGGREAGASTAAAFLSHFVGETPWAHLDIAGTGWTDKVGPYQPHGGTGVPVRTLVQWMRDWQSSRRN